MKKYFTLVVMISLIACQLVPKTLDEQFSEACINGGYQKDSKDYDDCIKAAYKAYDDEIKKIQKAEAEYREKMRKQQLAADAKKCNEYGYKKGSNGFADCMLKIEQSRIQQQQHEQAIASQQAAVAQQIEAQRQLNALQYLQNYNLQQQAIQAQQNQRVQMNCTTSQMGGFGNINCY
jgi:DNA-binding helix-hairpin-helix protein with protein kinase domain